MPQMTLAWSVIDAYKANLPMRNSGSLLNTTNEFAGLATVQLFTKFLIWISASQARPLPSRLILP